MNEQVSIRARHHWRAIPTPFRCNQRTDMFQSAPAITGGRSPRSKLTKSYAWQVSIRARHHWRAIRLGGLHGAGVFGVSIRARHHWRAIPLAALRSSSFLMFQSAPAITGGRSGPRQTPARPSSSFNPRPPSLAGDPTQRLPLPLPRQRFNPRPPSLAGDPVRRISVGRATVVSIRARHHWRAIPPGAASAPRCLMFQSAPAITGGGSVSGPRGRSLHFCFNPRPPSLAGDPDAALRDYKIIRVSIRARHHWRAIRLSTRPDRFLCVFQSAPAITGGRSAAARCSSRLERFQSAPAITGGRSHGVSSGVHQTSGFNPRPPSLAGDPTAARPQAAPRASFNPRPPSLAGDPAPCSGLRNRGDVSIRARHHWRAILDGGLEVGVGLGVSIRARHHWRAIPAAPPRWRW